MNVNLLYQKYAGKTLSYDGIPANAGQCVQWAEYVLTDSQYGYGLQPFYGNAIDWWNKFGGVLSKNFDQITDGSIKAGDFVIFNQNVGSVYGHIDMALQDGTIDSFLGADSNWGGNLTVHQVQHTGRQYVTGSLRLKGSEESMFNEGDAVNFNNYFFGKDNGLFRDQVGQTWKTAAYNIMEYMKTNNNLLFNEGDRQNINEALYGKDMNRFGSSVNESWKQAVYDIIQNHDFITDALINQGDVTNLGNILNTAVPNSVIGKDWKDFVYYDLPGLLNNISDINKASVVKYIQEKLS